ncbi:MAG: sulfite exporter TauE/SafE family protein [Deltaproteobacteria bacterium]|nr:sulfite exporter TauE/SafE family protein [Deltaproteobacteria bacterium]
MFHELLNSLGGYLQSGSAVAYFAVFLGGILTSFTPCVYPVIPVTVGFIGSRSQGSRARGFFLSLSYVLGMAVMYAALGSVAALTGKIFGEVGSSPASYFIAGNVCLLLGLSLFDLVRLPLPSFQTGGGPVRKPPGFLGAFAVGMISGLIVGPCTAPVLGALLLYVGSRQNVLFGTSLLFVFALGLGFLILLIGTFTGLVAGLAKTGKWADRVKKGFGFLLLLVAEYLFIEAGKLLA